MVADGRCPDVIAMLDALAVIERTVGKLREHRIMILQGRADDRPVDEVGGMKDLQARKTGKRRGSHIIIIAHPAYVGIAIVRIDDGILIHATRKIRVPGVGKSLSAGCCGCCQTGESCHEGQQERFRLYHIYFKTISISDCKYTKSFSEKRTQYMERIYSEMLFIETSPSTSHRNANGLSAKRHRLFGETSPAFRRNVSGSSA